MKMLNVVAFLVSGLVSGAFAQERPQEPVEPYPYESIEVTIPCGVAEGAEPTHTLAGTLTIPDAAEFGEGPFVGVVLMSGSGPQDRDETLMGHKPFLVLADYLTRHGIAVLRYDDRGIGESTGTFGGTTTIEFSEDAQTAAHFLMEHEKVNPDRVGIMGHSEGGLAAPFIADRDESIAFIVLLAGTGVPISDVLIDQTAAMYRSQGNKEEYVEAAMGARRKLFDAIAADADEEELIERMMVVNRVEWGLKDETQLRTVSVRMLPQFTNRWMRGILSLDPREPLGRLRIPVLALNGTKDFQVSVRMNLDSIRTALENGGNTQYTIVELAGLNHLFQHSHTGMLDEYSTIEETFAPEAMAIIESWIRTVNAGD
ncbi:MAG: alpha/beta hydrolase [Phycisphaerales bacterium]|nr:alpha/beta hydrolase [Phycisphaerales bacterium]